MKNTVCTHVYLELLRSTNHCILSFEEPELVSNFACMKKQGAGCTWDWPYPLTKVSSEIIDAMREIFQRKSIRFNQVMTTKTLKNLYREQTMTFIISLKGEKTKYENKNRKFSRLRATIEDWKTCSRPILAGCSKRFLLSVRK